MNDLLMGIDIGTGGCKVTLLTREGNFVSDGYTEYPTYHPYPNWSEQDPSDWYPAFRSSFDKALRAGGVSPEFIIGIATDASTHNAVLLDKDSKVLRRCIMWTDQRSTDESKYLNDNFGDEIFAITYQKPSPTWTLPQLMWIKKNEPEVFSKVHRIMFTKDYVRNILTGTWETDYVDAQGSMMFDNASWGWSTKVCEMGGIPMSILPHIVEPTRVVGGIRKEIAAETGLKEGIPVVAGASDSSLEEYGVGGIEPGVCVVKMATAGVVSVFSTKPRPNPKALTYSHVIPGMWYTCLATSSAAHSLRWYRDTFCGEELAKERAGGSNVYRVLDDESERVRPGSDGLFFHPYLMGERSPYWDANLRGSFTGISAYHHRGHFNRAILEGVAYSLKDNFSVIDQMGFDTPEVRFIGGGAKSPLWRKILADVLDKPVLKLETDDSSFGAAMLAGVGIGVFSDHRDAVRRCVKIKERVMPDSANAAVYREMFGFYKRIHDVLEGTYRELGAAMKNLTK